MRPIFLVVLATALFFSNSGPVHAAPSPLDSAFTYQGKLTEGDGLAEGTFDFVFTLFDSLEGGSPVSANFSLDDVTVTNGSFTADLVFEGDPFNGEERFLEVFVRSGSSEGPYSQLSPRQRVAPTPYSLLSKKSLSLDWEGLMEVPDGFSDGIDNDTKYTSGAGLILGGTQFSVDFAPGNGSSSSVARADHTHGGEDIVSGTVREIFIDESIHRDSENKSVELIWNSSGTTHLAEVTSPTDSGASLIGVFDEFHHSDSTDLQSVLRDFDDELGIDPPLFSLSDVTITGVTDNEVLSYDSASGEWINQTLAEAGIMSTTDFDTEAEFESLLTDVSDVFTNNDTVPDGNIAATITRDSEWDTTAELEGASGDNLIIETEVDTEAEVESILTDVTDLFTNNDGALEDDDLTDDPIATLSDVTITSVTDNEVLSYNATSGEWINQTPAEAGIMSTTDFDTEAELEALLTDVSDVFTDNDTVPEGNIDAAITRDTEWDTTAELEAASGDNLIIETEIDTAAEFDAIVTDGALDDDDLTDDPIATLSDVTITSVTDNEVLSYDSTSGEWINQTPAEAGIMSTTDFDTEAELEALLTDVSDVFTDNDTVPEGNIDAAITRDTEWDTTAELETASGDNLIIETEIDTAAEFDAIVTDGALDDDDLTDDPIATLSDVTITSVTDNEVLSYDATSGEWINQTPAEAGIMSTTDFDTEAELEALLTDVSDVFTNNDGALDDDDVTDDDVETMSTSGGSGTAPLSDGVGGLTMTDVLTETELDTEAELESQLTDVSDVFTNNDGALDDDDLTDDPIATLSDVTITSVTDNEVLSYDSTSGEWINQTAAEAGIMSTTDFDTEAELEALLTDVSDVFTNNDGALDDDDVTDDDVETMSTSGGSGTAPLSDGVGGLTMTDVLTETELDSEAELESQLTDVSDVFTNNDGALDDDDLTDDPIATLSDVTITSVTDNEVLSYDSTSGEWINQTPAEAGIMSTTDFDTEAELEALLTDVSDVFTDNDTVPEGNIDAAITRDTEWDTTAELEGASGDNLIIQTEIDTAAEFDAIVTDGALDDDDLTDNIIADLSDVTITSVTHNEVLSYDSTSGEWINQTPAEAGIVTATDIDTEAGLESFLTDVSDLFTNNDTVPEGNIDAAITRDTEWDTTAELETASGDNLIIETEIDTAAEFNAIVTDGALDDDDLTDDPIATLSDVTITSVTDNEVLSYDSSSGDWINQTAAEAGIVTATDIDTEAGLESFLTDVSDLFTNNDGALDDDDVTDDDVETMSTSGGSGTAPLSDGVGGLTMTDVLTETELDTEAELESQLTDVSDVFTNNDGALDDDDLTDNVIADLSDVTITSVTDNEVLSYDSASGDWINQTAAEAGIMSTTDFDTEAELESLLTDVSDVFTNNDTVPEGNIDAAITRDTEWDTTAELEGASGDNLIIETEIDTAAEFDAIVTDGALDDDDLTDDSIATLSDVTITSVTDNEVLSYDSTSGEWINQTAAEAGIVTATDIDTEAGLEAILTDVSDVFTNNDTVPDGNIAATITRDSEWDTTAELEGASGDNLIIETEVDTEAEVEAILTDVTDLFTNNDGALDDDDLTDDPIATLSDVTITSVTDNEVLSYDSTSGEWINQTAAEAGIMSTTDFDTEAELEALLTDVSDVFTDNDTVPEGNIDAAIHRDTENKDVQFVGNTAGTTILSETTAANDSGAFLIGAFDEFNNSASTNVQDVLDDLDAAIDTAGSQNLFQTMDAPNGTDPVADTSTDTLQFLDGNSITVTGNSGADSLTIGVTDDSIDGDQLADAVTLDTDNLIFRSTTIGASDHIGIRISKNETSDSYNLGMDTDPAKVIFSAEDATFRQALGFGDVLTDPFDTIFGISSSSDSGSTWTPRLVIEHEGDVGIGTHDVDETLHVANSSGDVKIKIENEDGGTNGDPAIEFAIGGTSNFTLGVDDSDSDQFKLSAGAALGTTDLVTISSTGNVTAATFTGDGSALTDLNGTQITTGTVADARIASTLTRDTEWDTTAELETASGDNLIIETEIDTAAEFDAIVTDGALDDDDLTDDPIATLSDVTITSVTDNEVLSYDSASGDWINQSAAEAGIVTATDIDTEAGLEALLTDVSDVFTDNDTVPEGNIDAAITRDTEWDTTAELETASGDNLIIETEIDTAAEFDAIVTDGALDDDDVTDDPIATLSDVTITSVTDNEVLAYDATSGEWINQTAAEAGIMSTTDFDTEAELESLLTDVSDVFTNNDTVPDGNIASTIHRDSENKDVQNVGNTAGTTTLNETTAANDSGAFLIGAFDEFNNSASTNVQDVLDDLDAAIDTAGAQNLFQTIDAPNGTDPVADTSTDTLQLLDGNAITITGNSGTDAVTVAVTDDSINGAQLADTVTLDANLALTGGFDVGIGTTGIDESLHVANSSGDVKIKIENEDGGTNGDPSIEFAIGGVSEFTLGVDDSDGDTFKISSGSALGTTDQLTIDTSGNTDITGDVTAAGGFRNTAGTWNQDDVAASQSGVTMTLLGATVNAEILMPYGGSVVGITVASNAARTNGTLTVEPRVNGTGVGLTAVLDGTNTQYHFATQAKDTDTFSAGDRIDVIITTTAPWAPTTADIVVTVIVEF